MSLDYLLNHATEFYSSWKKTGQLPSKSSTLWIRQPGLPEDILIEFFSFQFHKIIAANYVKEITLAVELRFTTKALICLDA